MMNMRDCCFSRERGRGARITMWQAHGPLVGGTPVLSAPENGLRVLAASLNDPVSRPGAAGKVERRIVRHLKADARYRSDQPFSFFGVSFSSASRRLPASRLPILLI